MMKGIKRGGKRIKQLIKKFIQKGIINIIGHKLEEKSLF